MNLIIDLYPHPFYIGATSEDSPELINSLYTFTDADRILDDASRMALFFYSIRNKIKIFRWS